MRLALCLLLAAVLQAADKTTITGDIRDGSGRVVSGKCSFTPGVFDVDGWHIVGEPVIVSFSGTFSTALVPGQYKVNCQSSSGKWSQTTWWNVTSTTPVNIADVEQDGPLPSQAYPAPGPDVTGDYKTGLTVTGIKGVRIDDSAKADGYALKYSSSAGKLIYGPAAPNAITAVVQDPAPILGGNLDLNGHNIGGVTPTEISYLAGLTAAIQGQIDGKASLSHTHVIGNVTGLQDALDAKQDTIAGAPGTWPSFGSLALLNNPMNSAGDLIVGGPSGSLLRLPAPGNGTFCPSWSGGVITWTACPGGIQGPGSATSGYIPQWSSTTGDLLSAGLPVSATPGANTVVQADGSGKISASWLPSTITASTSGNAATATALASAPTLCDTGEVPTGIDVNGNAVGCAPPVSSGLTPDETNTITIDSGQIGVTPGAFAPMPPTPGFIYGTGPSATASRQINRVIHAHLSLSGQVLPTGPISATGVPITDTCTLSSYTILSNPSGSATVGVWKANAAIPTIANEITNGNPMALSSSVGIWGATPSGWTTTSVSPGDTIILNLLSVTNSTSLDISLYCTL